MLQWSNQRILLKLNFTWSIARGADDEKVNFIISVREDDFQGLGEVAPNIRYGETPESIEQQFAEFMSSGAAEVATFQELKDLMDAKQLSAALSFGLESAYVHLQSQKLGVSVSDYLGLPAALPRATMFSIPMMDPGKIADFLEIWRLDRFHLLKVKVDGERALAIVNEVCKHTDKPIIVDCNEGFSDPDAYLKVERDLPRNRIVFVEQPLPADMKQEQHFIRSQREIALWADESFHGVPDWTLKEQFDGLNVKLMKMGGYFNAIEALREARSQGLSTMMGCMVETSLGLASAMRLSPLSNYLDLDSFLYLQEDPFQHVREEKGVLYLEALF